ncbi:GTP-binding protein BRASSINAZOLE INSENSITIVE PALE GREEN 2, chloroplastic [Primulina tabacum]|uniref:GTP-binding protein BRASSINAZOLE INSENSITIVE PALE GREEN 2, chloroplastic n=1 Tax=Primulina tabacum TaxID=48773 RepID=UPI003F5ABFB6
MIVRNLLLLRLKKLLTPLSLASDAVFNSLHSSPVQNPAKTLMPIPFFNRPFSSQPEKIESFSLLQQTRDGNYDYATSQTFPICVGCGVPMQDSDCKRPGFFTKPLTKCSHYKKFAKMDPIFDESEISDSLKRGVLNEIIDVGTSQDLATNDHAFCESSNLGRLDEKLATEKPIVCSRCHSLRYYGKVRDPSVENLLPDFDFDHTVGRRLMSVSGARTVVLLVVDVADFDGSFPRKVASLISRISDQNDRSWKEGKPGNVPRLILVVTKIDLLPSSISPTRLEHWVRTRSREDGAGKLSSVHLISAVKDWGVRNLLDDVVKLVGPRGHVWAVGAQNAGKSTLINAIGKCVGGEVTHLTEAPVPGTTLGIVRVEGVLPGKAKLFDTPGLLNPHQISSRLNAEEQKLVRIEKELKPKTYRIKAGHSIHIGGLMRLDVEESSVESIYITVWASPLLPLHMGKSDNSCMMLEKHFGHQLQPPIGEGRIEELGKWVKKEFHVSGVWWDSSSVDIAAAGLGWFAIGLKGEARLGVWTYEGIDVVVRNSLLPQRSINFEVAGFSVSDIVSKADKASSKKRQKDKKTKHRDLSVSSPGASSPLVVDTAASSKDSIDES